MQVGTIAKDFWPQSSLGFIPSCLTDLTPLFGPKLRDASAGVDDDRDFVLPPSSPYYTLEQKKEFKGTATCFPRILSSLIA
jgi:hypothetical protein